MNASAAALDRPESHVEEPYDDPGQQLEAATLGMWLFLATEILFFGVLFTGYTVLRVLHPQGFAAASRLTDMLLGTVETAALLISSSLMALAVRAVKLDRERLAAGLMVCTALLGTAFLVMHGFEYHKEYTDHLIPGINFARAGPQAHTIEIFFFLYYCITGFHSLHVAIGVCLILVLAAQVARGRYGAQHYTRPELTGLYWHLVDIVWIFVYPLIYLIGRGARL